MHRPLQNARNPAQLIHNSLGKPTQRGAIQEAAQHLLWNMRCAVFPFSILLLLLAPITGCSRLHKSPSSQVAIDPAYGSNVHILKDAWNWDVGFHYAHQGENIALIQLDNREPVHLIRLEQPGAYPEVYPLFPLTRNPFKALDLGGAVACTAGGAVLLASQKPKSAVFAAFAGAVANGLGVLTKPKKVYKRSYDFDGLEPIPIGNPSNPNLHIEGFHMRIPEGKHSWHYFQNMDRYHDDRVEFISASDESIQIEYSNLDEELNKVLIAQGFQPEPQEGMFQRGEAIEITGELIGVREHRVQNIVRYELETAWWLYNAFGIAGDTAHVTTSSNWALYNFSDPGFDRELISEAVVHSMFQSLASEAFNGKLNRIENLESEWTKDWYPIALSASAQPAGRISSALQSVVTVEASDGHGSGCIVSADGYIVTNYHVIADGADAYPIHFQNGENRTARVVRYHPVHDLALLKVDTTDLVPFHLNMSETINVGEAAYALGTPYDIDLGASVTKGIISGKRKDASRTLIQTDVSISPGNSGGALIDENGTLIGIINEKVLGMGVDGIGFAIPTNVIPDALKIEFNR